MHVERVRRACKLAAPAHRLHSRVRGAEEDCALLRPRSGACLDPARTAALMLLRAHHWPRGPADRLGESQ